MENSHTESSSKSMSHVFTFVLAQLLAIAVFLDRAGRWDMFPGMSSALGHWLVTTYLTSGPLSFSFYWLELATKLQGPILINKRNIPKC